MWDIALPHESNSAFIDFIDRSHPADGSRSMNEDGCKPHRRMYFHKLLSYRTVPDRHCYISGVTLTSDRFLSPRHQYSVSYIADTVSHWLLHTQAR